MSLFSWKSAHLRTRASSWLSTLPIEDHGFALHKGAFRDALCFRYGWRPPLLPSQCVCGAKFTIEHSLNCPRGGFPSIRHNEIRDITADLLSEVCHNVGIEPSLQSISGEHLFYRTANREDGARLDVVAESFWGKDRQLHFSTLGFSILTHRAIATLPLLNATNKTNSRKKSLWPTSKRDRTRILLTPCFLYHWRYGAHCHNSLQKTGLSDCKKSTTKHTAKPSTG